MDTTGELINARMEQMSKEWFAERSRTQMTLGGLIDVLESMDRTVQINLGHPNSYRGYCSDLALEPCNATVQDLLNECRSVMGHVLYGYKGGEFIMHQSTPVWVASWGRTGRKLIAVSPNGDYITAPDEYQEDTDD